MIDRLPLGNFTRTFSFPPMLAAFPPLFRLCSAASAPLLLGGSQRNERMPRWFPLALSVKQCLLWGMLLFAECLLAAPWTAKNHPWNVNANPDGSNPALYYGKAPIYRVEETQKPDMSSTARRGRFRWQPYQQQVHWRRPSATPDTPAYPYFASPVDWRQESIYQVITDRFRDGDPTNNEGSHFHYGGYDLRHVNTRHGGDFQGLKQSLPYIRSLGYTAIWVSPVFQNLENQYHGYAQTDFTLLDDRFGTLQDFQEFVQEAHRLGIYVLVDIVVNHMADLYYFEGYRGAQRTPFRMHKDEYRMFPHNESRTYADFWVNNEYIQGGRYCTIYNDRGQRVEDTSPFEGSFWNSDFHHNGDLRDDGYGDPWNNHLGKIYGIMDDLRTTHPRVTDKIIAMTKALITSTDIDGIRVDTPMQVPLSFFQRWAPALRSHAESLGKKNFGIFGEFYTTRERASTMTGRGITKTFDRFGRTLKRSLIGTDEQDTMDGGIYYPFYEWIRNSIKDHKSNLNGLMSLLQADLQDLDFYNPRANWEFQYRHLHFYNNHDQWRLAASTPEDGHLKTLLASSIITFWPGIPLFYYGDEQAFDTPGTALDGWAREDFMTSLAWSNQDACCKRSLQANPSATGTCNKVSVDNFDQCAPPFQHVQKLMNIRRNYPSLRACDTVVERWHQVNFMNGIYGYSRECGANQTQTDAERVLVLFNTWKSTLIVPRQAMFSGWKAAVELWDVTGPYEDNQNEYIPKYRLTTDARGTIQQELTLDGYMTRVFVLKETFVPLDPVVVQVQPAHDQFLDADTVGEWVEISVRFSQPMDVLGVWSGLRVNGETMDKRMRIVTASSDPRLFQFRISRSALPDGIHHITVDAGVESAMTARTRMHAPFSSRFRLGSARTNVLMNPCLNFGPHARIQAIAGLRKHQQPSQQQRQVTLKHFASGAEKVRVLFGMLEEEAAGTIQWQPWRSYANVTQHVVPDDREPSSALVQYWADGSAAYYVTVDTGLFTKEE